MISKGISLNVISCKSQQDKDINRSIVKDGLGSCFLGNQCTVPSDNDIAMLLQRKLDRILIEHTGGENSRYLTMLIVLFFVRIFPCGWVLS